jgi:uncharacterized RDD family membrane protein YckC
MADTMYCSQCGAPTTAGAVFCQRCGSRMVAAVPSVPASTAVATAPVAVIPVMPESCYGGFWIRLAAYLIDHVVLGALFVPAFFIFVFPAVISAYHGGFDEYTPPPPGLVWAIAIFVFVAMGARLLYEILLTSSSWQGTIGKKLLRLKVTDDFGNRISVGRSTGRFFAKLLSSAASYIGYIMIAFMDRKRGLHDVIARTQVLRY